MLRWKVPKALYIAKNVLDPCTLLAHSLGKLLDMLGNELSMDSTIHTYGSFPRVNKLAHYSFLCCERAGRESRMYLCGAGCESVVQCHVLCECSAYGSCRLMFFEKLQELLGDI